MLAERDSRRVIGPRRASPIPDGEVEGVGEHELLALYRSMVLLRTYDERSVVYHRQGRIGTYAIYWGHEAIQAGAVHALERRGLDLPELSRVGDRAAARHAGRDDPPWWRGHPSGWWNPADYNLASICVPIATQVPHAAGLAWGKRLRGDDAVALAFFGDGATSEGAFHEGANFAGGDEARRSSSSATTTSGRSRRRSPRRRAAATLADKAAGYGIPGVRVDGERRARGLRGDARGRRARPRRRGADARRGGDLPRRAARDGRRPERVHRSERVEEERERECVGRFEGYLRRRGSSTTTLAERDPGGGARRDARRDRRGGGRAARRPGARVRARPPTRRRRAPRRARGRQEAPQTTLSCTLVEAVNDALHARWRATRVLVLGEDVAAPAACSARPRAARRFGADRCVDTPLAEAAIVGAAVGSAWRASGPSARCSTTRSRTRASTS